MTDASLARAREFLLRVEPSVAEQNDAIAAQSQGARPGEGFVPSHILLLRDALRLAEHEHQLEMEVRRLAP